MLPSGFSVTLVEPEYPVNVGHVARLMKNFGATKLFLVRPKVDLSVASIYASHGAGILDSAERTSLNDVRKRHEILIATTAIRARRRSNVLRRSIRPEKAASLIRGARSASLVLGRDTTGLTNDEIKRCDIVTTIDTGTTYTTLNVSHAAAIMLYLVAHNKLGARTVRRRSRDLFADQLHELAVAAKFQRHKRAGLREAIKHMTTTSQLSEKELFMMTGIFRKAIQAMRDKK
jgi:TrmH family RNA methyltransferase